MRRIVTLLLSMLALPAAPALGATTVQVGGTGFNYTPQNVTIAPGDAIHWNWAGSNHSVTSGATPPGANGLFDSAVFDTGHMFDFTFNHPGVYHYFCKIHYAEGMVGTITVTGSDPAPTAAFSVSSDHPATGDTVTFNAAGSSASDGDTIDTYSWDFGDGTGTQTTSSPTITHRFSNPGSATAKLTVTDAGSQTSAPVAHGLLVTGSPIPKDGSAPAVASKVHLGHKRFCTRKSSRCRRPGTQIKFSLSKAAVVKLVVKRRGKVLVRRRVQGHAGRNSVRFRGKGLKPGRYVLNLAPAGGMAIKTRFVVIAA